MPKTHEKIHAIGRNITEESKYYPILETLIYFYLSYNLTGEENLIFSKQEERAGSILSIVKQTIEILYNTPKDVDRYDLGACRTFMDYKKREELKDPTHGTWTSPKFQEKSMGHAEKALESMARVAYNY